jgi:hypothetical protein
MTTIGADTIRRSVDVPLRPDPPVRTLQGARVVVVALRDALAGGSEPDWGETRYGSGWEHALRTFADAA